MGVSSDVNVVVAAKDAVNIVNSNIFSLDLQ